MQSLPPASCSAHCWGLSEQRFEMLSSGNLMYRTVQEKRRNCTTLVCSKASPVVPSFGEPVLSIQKRLGGHLECALLPLLDFHANLIYRNFSFHYQRRRSHLLPFPAFAFCPFQIPFAIVISSYVVKSAFCRGRTYPPRSFVPKRNKPYPNSAPGHPSPKLPTPPVHPVCLRRSAVRPDVFARSQVEGSPTN